MEIRQGKLILYGCGDFINDYEGIGGYERYRPDLGIAYFVDLDDDSGRLLGLDMVVFRRRRFRLERATRADTQWMQSALSRHSELSRARLQVGPDASILLRP
jgi:poly-gamma-glutamate synthesis protein (capsule biosynthesis protein)